jgi:hypothetical protein
MIFQTRNVYERECKNLKENDYLGELSMEARLIRQNILKKQGVRMRNSLNLTQCRDKGRVLLKIVITI